MALKLADLKNSQRTRTCPPISYGDDTINITYYIDRVGDNELQDAKGALETSGSLVADQNAFLARVIASWDILDEDDQPLPITVENLELLPWSVKASLAFAVMRNAQLGEVIGGTSDGPSSTEANGAASRNGTRRSSKER